MKIYLFLSLFISSFRSQKVSGSETQEFTEPELQKLTEFYKTPLGKKASEKMPQLALLAGQLGLKKAQAHQAELRQMLEDQKNTPGGGG